ncbi:Uncharacterised protein [Mycobacterium tuberculosis]|nr:Uncharacterised protein [Mycobacterium tuberculosis]
MLGDVFAPGDGVGPIAAYHLGMVTAPAVWAMAGTSVTAVAPLPMITIRSSW